MLTLNLLPIHAKEEYAADRRRRFTVSIGISLSMVLATLSALLFSTNLFITIHHQAVKEAIASRENSESVRRLADLKKSIRAMNARIGTVIATKGTIVPTAPILERITALADTGIYLKSISLDMSANAVKLDGFAETREGVLAFAAALESSGLVVAGSFENPVKNILKPSDIGFSFTFKVQP